MTLAELFRDARRRNGRDFMAARPTASLTSSEGAALPTDEVPLLELLELLDREGAVGVLIGWSQTMSEAIAGEVALKIYNHRLEAHSVAVDCPVAVHLWMRRSSLWVPGDAPERGDACPRCGDVGEWAAMALRCRRGCGVFLGG